MNWYLTKLVFRIICGDGGHKPQFDEQLRLISAEDNLHAFQKARGIGEREQDIFMNNINKPVNWKFVDVSEIHRLDDLIDGAEMYSKICEQEDADIYIRHVRLKAKQLFEESLNKSFQQN